MKKLLKEVEAMLVALQWAKENGDGCDTCGYGATHSCPACSHPEGDHYKSCELQAIITKLQKTLTA